MARVRYNIRVVRVPQTDVATYGAFLVLAVLGTHPSDRRGAIGALPVQETFGKTCNEFTKIASVQYASQFGVVL